MPSKLSTIILAGGHSRRMGQDKALLPWQGRPLIQHLVAQLKELSDDVLVITGPEVRYTELLDVPVFADEPKERGPIGGLYTGLKHARYAYSLAVACDMPRLDQWVLKMLKIDSSVWAVVPEVGGHRVPTLAIYHKNCVEVIERLLAEDHTSLQELLDLVPTKVVPESQLREVDPLLRCFTNLNSPEDWTSAVK